MVKLTNKISVLSVEIPIWYSKEEMYRSLLRNNYSHEIANELSEKWAEDLQQSLRKGFELGFRYAKGEEIEASVTIKKIATN